MVSSFFQRYQRSLVGNPQVIAKARREQNDLVNSIAFPLADGYKLAKLQSRDHYDKNVEAWEDFEILVKHALSETEKKIVTRPHVDLALGTYLKYDDVTVLVKGRTLGKEEVMPTYKAYVCNHMLKLKGCPYEFPISSSNTSYSAKGVLDADLVQLIDSRNRFYIQRNKYTVRLFENHKNYRIALGDDEVKYYYTISNMDDTSTPGVFTVTLVVDERTHLDGEYAFNEKEIDYSDLNDIREEDGEVIEAKPLPILTCNTYQYLNKPFSLVSNIPIKNYVMSEGLELLQVSDDQLEFLIQPIATGIQKVTIHDHHSQEVSKNIMVKEG